MRFGLTLLLSSLFTVLVLVGSGCGIHYYKVINQEPVDAKALASSATFKWRTISFAGIERLPEYANDQDWTTDIQDVQKEYLEIVAERAGKAGLADKVATVGLEAEVTEGIVIEPAVKRIKQEYGGAASGGYDYLYVDLLFKDAATGKVLFQSHVECTSMVAFGPIGWRARSLSGRLALASWNTIPPIISIIERQEIKPLQD